MKTVISGASDDLIDISGAISDEAQAKDGLNRIKASDGTVAKISYNGTWKIQVITIGNAFEKLLSSCGEEKPVDPDTLRYEVASYSDALVFNKPLQWIKINDEMFKPKNYAF